VYVAAVAASVTAAAPAAPLHPKGRTKQQLRLWRRAALELQEIMEWDVVEFAAYGKERVGLVLQVEAPSSCVVQPLVREEETGVWVENSDVAATEVDLATVRVYIPLLPLCIGVRSLKLAGTSGSGLTGIIAWTGAHDCATVGWCRACFSCGCEGSYKTHRTLRGAALARMNGLLFGRHHSAVVTSPHTACGVSIGVACDFCTTQACDFLQSHACFQRDEVRSAVVGTPWRPQHTQHGWRFRSAHRRHACMSAAGCELRRTGGRCDR
jgi:hypothetical protein